MEAIFDSGLPEPCPAPFNLAAYVMRKAADHADKIALGVVKPSGAERWSFGRLEAAVLGTATGLIGLGLSPGDRILMRLGNTVDFPVTYLGAIAAGIIPVPTSSLLTTPEVTRIASETDPSLIVAGEGVALPHDPACPVLSLAELRAMRDLPAAEYRLAIRKSPHMSSTPRARRACPALSCMRTARSGRGA